MEAEGRYVFQRGGRCRYARVRVRYTAEPPALGEPRASLADGLAENSGWSAHELAAAVEGAARGLEVAGAPGTCVVTWMHDPDSVPPNVSTPQAIATAAARAVWAAVGYVPDEGDGTAPDPAV